jgi:DNA-binding beta-propeller fold protein YncE
MKQRTLITGGVLLILLASVPIPAKPQVALGYKSPLGIAIDQDATRAYVALSTAGAIAIVDLNAGKVLQEIPVGKRPHDIALVKNSLFVTCEQDDTLVQIDLTKNAVVKRWTMKQSPQGVVVLADGSRVLVTCHDDKSLVALEPATGKMQVVSLPGWPRRLVTHGDSQYPFALVIATDTGETLVSLTDAKLPPRLVHTTRLAGISNPRGLAIKPGISSYALLVHQKPRTKVPATQIAQGWVFTNAVSTFSPWGVDTPPGGGNRARVLDEPNRGFTDPSDVVLLPNERYVFIACAGADTVLALRPDKFVSANYAPLVIGSDGNHPLGKDELTLSRHYVVAKLQTGANPRRLALSGDGKILVAANHLGDSLTVIDTAKLKVLKHIPLGGPKLDAARRGEILFNSSTMTFHGQFTCASCHPKGGADGLNWDLSRDGIGNFMNTRSLLGVKDSAPYGWLGTSPTLADRVSGTLRTLHRHEPQCTEVADIVAYLKTLSAPRPLPQKETDKPAIERGKVLFQGKAKCANCHRRDALDDNVTHDVGTRVPGDFQDRFDTPSLRGVSRTAPYLHHGQAQTLQEVFSKYNPHRRHGAAHLLDPQELADLLAYLKSL